VSQERDVPQKRISCSLQAIAGPDEF